MSKTSGVYLWMVLTKTHQTLQKRAEKSIEATGMCFSDFRILEVLMHKGPLPVNSVGARTNLTSGSATTAIDRLAARSLVERAGDPQDRRARIVHLTSAGEKLIEKVFAKHAKAMEKVAADLSIRERGDLAGLLKKLNAGAKGD